MKGYFTLGHDPYTNTVTFGNLTEDTGSLGSLRDTLRGEYNMTGRLIAHDVVEHSLSHRKKTYVTYEAEMRAVGAVSFVRNAEFDLYNEMHTQCEYLHRDLVPVPHIIGQGLIDSNDIDTGMIRALIKRGCSPYNARCAAFHFAWGARQKAQQFNWCNYAARNAFNFIESNVSSTLQEIEHRDSWGASVYFDTTKHIFRTRMKWRN